MSGIFNSIDTTELARRLVSDSCKMEGEGRWAIVRASWEMPHNYSIELSCSLCSGEIVVRIWFYVAHSRNTVGVRKFPVPVADRLDEDWLAARIGDTFLSAHEAMDQISNGIGSVWRGQRRSLL